MMQPVPWPKVKRSLVAILRGIHPDEAEVIVETLIDSGFELIEVPLNSPDPFVSIERLCKRFGNDCYIGAGTVLNATDCARVADLGGRLMVSPNVDADVLAMAQARQLVTMPGVFSPTEAFLALRCGASALKFFPASVLGIRALGLGSSLYRPGMTAPEVREAALTSVHAYDRLG